MADTTHPASLAEAKEAARQRMLDAMAQASKDDATQATQTPPPEDESVPPTDASLPSDEDDPDEVDDPQDDDNDEEDDEDDDSSDDDEDDSDEDDDAADEPVQRKQDDTQKRKPSRRSKRINKLQDEVNRLKAANTDAEERMLQRLEQEQARRAALESEKRQREADDRALDDEMVNYLGSDDEYRKAVKAALNGDVFEAEKARLWDEHREIYTKMNRRAEARVNQKAAEIFWASTTDLAGVDKEILQKADFGTVLKHLHEAGYGTAEATAKKELAKKDAIIAKLEGKLKEKTLRKASSTRQEPLEGGTPVQPKSGKTIYEQALDPVTKRIDREKFERLQRAARTSAN